MTAGFAFNNSAGPSPPSGGWRIGLNVPWSVSWTAEQNFDLAISQDFPNHVDLVQADNPAEGAPRFRAMHVTRHRRGMASHLCHVCGRPTALRDRYIFPIQSGAMAAMPDDSLRYAGNVPPVHLTCGQRAAKLCPHLSAQFSTPVAYPTEPSRLMPRTDIPPGMEQVARALPRHFKIVFTCYRLYGPKFSATVAKLRRDAGVV